MSASSLREELQHFRYKGNPIHPALIEDFVGPLDGSPPRTILIDIDKADTVVTPIAYRDFHGFVSYSDSERHGDEGYFKYHYLGRTPAGTYVIKTASSGGGSGVFMTLLFLRCRVETPGPRLLLECLGEFCLGDRDNGTVRLEGDNILIGASKYRAQEVILDLR